MALVRKKTIVPGVGPVITFEEEVKQHVKVKASQKGKGIRKVKETHKESK